MKVELHKQEIKTLLSYLNEYEKDHRLSHYPSTYFTAKKELEKVLQNDE